MKKERLSELVETIVLSSKKKGCISIIEMHPFAISRNI